ISPSSRAPHVWGLYPNGRASSAPGAQRMSRFRIGFTGLKPHGKVHCRILPYPPASPMLLCKEVMKSTIDPLAFQQTTRLLRCQKTNRYFTGSGWTEDQSKAKPFHSEIDIAEACVCHDLHNVDLILVAPLTGTELFSTPVR